jgi:hypothetical protein
LKNSKTELGKSRRFSLSIRIFQHNPAETKLFLVGSVDRSYRVKQLPEPKFECFTDKAGKFRFRLIAANGEKIATGEAYTSKDSCMKGIESVKKNAPIAKIVEVKE